MRGWRVVAALLAALGLLSTAGCGDDRQQSLQDVVDRWRERAQVPAVVVAVQGGGAETEVVTSGSPQRGGGERVAADAPFRIASITKTFVAVVVLQLVEEGRLSLEDRVADVVRDIVPDVVADEVTVRHLLSHTSGVPDYGVTQGFGERLLTDRDRRFTTSEVLSLVSGLEPEFTPGSDFRYSNTNYVLLAEVIEASTGHDWATAVRTRILDPLSLGDTWVAGVERSDRGVLPGYFDADNDGDRENVETGGPWPALETSEGAAGAIVSTASDVAAFGSALFGGRLLSAETMSDMLESPPHHPRAAGYGLGIEIVRPDYRTEMVGHGGFVPGFRSALWYSPSRDAVIVVLANDSMANPTDLAELILRRLPAAGLDRVA